MANASVDNVGSLAVAAFQAVAHAIERVFELAQFLLDSLEFESPKLCADLELLVDDPKQAIVDRLLLALRGIVGAQVA